MKKFFYCYSVNLKKYLMNNGLRYDVVAVNPNSNKTFWRFERNEVLDDLLTQWSKK